VWQRLRSYLERWLFAPLAGRSAAVRARRLAQYFYALLRDLLGGQLNLHAMGLVYATLLALVPLVAFSFAILKVFGAHRDLEPLIFEFFKPMGEAAGELTQKVMDFADRVRSGIVGSVGLGLLIWTLVGTLKKVEDSLNFVWHVDLPRSFMRRIAEYLALLVVAPLLVAALIGMARMPQVGSSIKTLADLPLLSQLSRGALALTPLVVVSGMFALVYALIPNTRVRILPALIGGVVAGLLWTTVGSVFTTIVVYSARLNIVYAGFAIFIAALIWIYFGWLILLVGAQLSFYVQNPSYLRVGLREPRLSNAETEQLALGMMYLVAHSHLKGGERWSINRLSASLQVPGVLVTRLADAFEAAGLLVTTEQEMLVPGRDASRIPLHEILSVARSANSVHGDDRSSAPPAVTEVCTQFEGAWREAIGARDLESLVVNEGNR
jgi:membrane protein